MNLRLIRIIFWGNLFVSLFSVLVVLVSRFVADIYFIELFASFLPTIEVLSFAMVLATGTAVFYSLKEKISLVRLVLFVSLGCWLISFLVSLLVVGSFFYGGGYATNEGGDTMKVLFYNKLYTNDDNYEIKKKILERNADIVGLAEVTNRDFEALSDKSYPYRYITDCVCVFGGAQNAIFSKYPILKADLVVFGKDSGLVLKAEVLISGKIVHLLVVHPHSPVSQYDVEMRAQDLGFLAGIMNNYKPSDVVVVMGDFNTPPWSLTYSDFAQRFEGKFINTALGKGVNFTWGKFLFQTQIDHFFVSKQVLVKSFRVLGNYGSDHRMIEVDVVF